MGILPLSAIIVDKAEPSEALKANIAWSLGLDRPAPLVFPATRSFPEKPKVTGETDVKGEKGALFRLCGNQPSPAWGETVENRGRRPA